MRPLFCNLTSISRTLLFVCLAIFGPPVLAGGTGLSGGSFAFCNQSLTTYLTPMSEIPGYSSYQSLIHVIAKKLPKLAQKLRSVENFD